MERSNYVGVEKGLYCCAPQERKRIQLQRDKIRSSELDPNKVLTQGKCTPIDAKLKENKLLLEGAGKAFKITKF